MSKFKVGEKLELIPFEQCKRTIMSFKSTHDSVRNAGLVTVQSVQDGYYVCDTNYKGLWCFCENELKRPDTTNKIIITSNGTTTTARLYDGKTVVKTAEAKCSPSDTYDFATGANLAYDRLMRPAVTAQPTVAAQPTAAEYREVKRAAKVGEKIKIVEVGFHGPELILGDIHTVTRVEDGAIETDKDNLFWRDEQHEYVVLEPITPTTDKTQDKQEIKLYCVKDCEPGVWLTKGKTYTLTLKRGSDRGSITFDDGWTDTMFNLDLGRMYGEKLGGNFLFPLVSRPAKVGEWVYALTTDGAGTKIKVGDIVKVTAVYSGGWATFKKPSCDALRPEQYLVLDGYNPAEPKTCECCGQIIKGEQS